MKLNAVIISIGVLEDLEKLGLTLRRPFDGLNSDEVGAIAVDNRGELWIGTDPLKYTSEEEFLAAVLRLTSPLQMKSPEHNTTYTSDSLSFEMLNLTILDTASVYFRYRKINDEKSTDETSNQTLPSTWSQNYSLTYKGYSRWTHGAIPFANGVYELQVFGLATDYSYPTSPDRIIGSILLTNSLRFRVAYPGVDWETIIVYGFSGAMLLAGVALVVFFLRKRRLALV